MVLDAQRTGDAPQEEDGKNHDHVAETLVVRDDVDRHGECCEEHVVGQVQPEHDAEVQAKL